MNYKQFIDAGGAINELSTIKGCDPKTKLKLYKIKQWANNEQECLKELIDNLNNTVKLPETVELNDKGQFKTGSKEDFAKYLEEFKPKEKELLEMELDCDCKKLSLDELMNIDTLSVGVIEVLDSIGLVEEKDDV